MMRTRRFAAEIQKTLSREDIAADYARFGLPIRLEPLFDGIYPLDHAVKPYGSTDVGTVSWVIPTVQCNVACFAPGTPFHSWQLVAQGKAPAAHKGIAVAAKAMAGLAKDLFTENGLLSAAKEEFRTFRDANEFRNPIGMEMTPPLEISA